MCESEPKLDFQPRTWNNDGMPATRIFTLADKQGRPTMRTNRQRQAEFMVRQGWTVCDVEVVGTPEPAITIARATAAAYVERDDNRDLVSPGLRLGMT